MQSGLTRLVVIGLAILAAVLAWKLHGETEARKKADFDLGRRSGDVLREKFVATGDLRAARLTGEAISGGACTSAFVFNNQQSTIAPFSVNYMIDLARIDRSDYRWDEKDRTMFVELPAIDVEAAAVDMKKARSQQSGLFVSRACGLAMQRQVAQRLEQVATARARRGDHMTAAAASARARVGQLVRSTLIAAGLEGVEVRVRLANDPRPADEQWDRSRSLDEVLAR